MDISYSPREIKLSKELNSLDTFVINFCSILDEFSIKYVLISGYVAIVFGRSRATEDVDLFLEDISYDAFLLLWKRLSDEGFECLATSRADEAYHHYLNADTALRFARQGQFIPNIEIKFPKAAVDHDTLAERVLLKLNHRDLYISAIESQIAFKLLLGSEKDLEDARYLHLIFRQYLDTARLEHQCRKLHIDPALLQSLYD